MVGVQVIGDLRVQEVVRGDGRRSFTIVLATGLVHERADRFLRSCRSGTDRTYAYLLLDHLRWLDSEGLEVSAVSLRELQRYMGAVGAEFRGPVGSPWREGKKPYGQSTLRTAAACVKAFYVFQGSQGVSQGVVAELQRERLPTQADRRRAFLGHTTVALPANPLAPAGPYKRHPKMPPEDARERLVKSLGSARDRLVVTWLSDGGFRVGELCSFHLVDLHLRDGAGCGECRSPHVHICHRETNPNRARVKVKHPWMLEAGTIRGGQIRRASPAMIHTYFQYLTTEYPSDAGHGMLLVQQHGPRAGEPWAPAGVRRMLGRAGIREDLGHLRPHAFRHGFTSAVLDASNGNSVIAREAGGWASAAMVEEVYGHPDVHDPGFSAALSRVWDQP